MKVENNLEPHDFDQIIIFGFLQNWAARVGILNTSMTKKEKHTKFKVIHLRFAHRVQDGAMHGCREKGGSPASCQKRSVT